MGSLALAAGGLALRLAGGRAAPAVKSQAAVSGAEPAARVILPYTGQGGDLPGKVRADVDSEVGDARGPAAARQLSRFILPAVRTPSEPASARRGSRYGSLHWPSAGGTPPYDWSSPAGAAAPGCR